MEHQHKVLLVEDDDDTRDALAMVLRTAGYDVCPARDGKDALARLYEPVAPCVILLDLMLPGMDGWAFREVQRSDPVLSDIPVALITAAPNVRTEARQLGVAAAFEKPALWLDDMVAFVEQRCLTRGPRAVSRVRNPRHPAFDLPCSGPVIDGRRSARAVRPAAT